jgi:tetratricopeptide (TPR) repeat protein
MQTCLNSPSTREPSLSWYDLPAEVKRLLIAAANSWEDTAKSQDYIHQALAVSDRSLDVLVAAYRYFFYKHNDAAALQIAIQVIEQIEQLEKLPDDWDELTPILSSRKEEPNIRLYLNAYAASGLVRARMGAIDDAKTIASRVNEIDSKREFGAATVLDILTNSDGEEED